MAPGRFTQWCGHLRIGESVNWEFESAEPLDMYLYHQEGRTVHYTLQREDVDTGAGTLQSSGDHQYCWMWTNRAKTPVALQARLQKPPAAREAREPASR